MKRIVGLAVVVGSAALALWQGGLDPVPLPVPRPDRGADFPGTSRDVGAALHFPASSTYQVIEERILFVPDRRIPAPEAPPVANAVPSPEPQQPALRLVGTFVSGNSRIALVALDGERHPQAVRQGGGIAGWAIEEIASRQVGIRSKDGRTTILLLQDAQPAAAAVRTARSPFVSARR